MYLVINHTHMLCLPCIKGKTVASRCHVSLPPFTPDLCLHLRFPLSYCEHRPPLLALSLPSTLFHHSVILSNGPSCHVRSQRHTGRPRLRHVVATSVPLKIRDRSDPYALSHVDTTRYSCSKYHQHYQSSLNEPDCSQNTQMCEDEFQIASAPRQNGHDSGLRQLVDISQDHSSVARASRQNDKLEKRLAEGGALVRIRAEDCLKIGEEYSSWQEPEGTANEGVFHS